MDSDPNKKKDQNPKKPAIKIKQINIIFKNLTKLFKLIVLNFPIY